MTTRIIEEREGRLIPHAVAREVQGSARMAPLIVKMTPEGIYFREKGRRTKYLLPYGTGWIVAARLYAEAERQRKKEERKARRAAR